jgi:hypothetical protein
MKHYYNKFSFFTLAFIHMKKALVILAVLFGAVYSASAQYYYHNTNNNDSNGDKLGIGIESGAAVGPVSGYYPEAGSISLRFEMPLNKSSLKLLFTTGYTFYASEGGYEVDYGYGYGGGGTYYSGSVASFIPVEIGLKGYVSRRIFLEGDAGVSFNVNTYPGDYTGSTTAFIFSPAIGYTVPLGYSRQSFDFSLLYENRPETGGGYQQIGLRAVWNFSL